MTIPRCDSSNKTRLPRPTDAPAVGKRKAVTPAPDERPAKQPKISDIRNALASNPYIKRIKAIHSDETTRISPELNSIFGDLFNQYTELDNTKLPKNVWMPKISEISKNHSKFLKKMAHYIAESYKSNISENEVDLNRVFQEAIEKTFTELGDELSLGETLSFFVFDTETNRLLGDAVSVGWIRFDITSKEKFSVEHKNLLLPPTFVSYGAERIHKMPLEWIKDKHISGETISAMETSLLWLKDVLASKAVIGFNVLYDINTMKQLFHCYSGIEKLKIDILFDAIADKFTLDSQDFLLRIDHHTRMKYDIPLPDTKESRDFYEKEYDDELPNSLKLPNRKLTTYAKHFLDMPTDNAHDALYDCVMTLSLFLFSLGVRNEVLKNEVFRNQRATTLKTYDRKITPEDRLSKNIYANHPQKSSLTQRADDSFLRLNPSLKPTPFIFRPLGLTTHRRHIIPKSMLFSLLNVGDKIDEKAYLYKKILSSEKFFSTAQERLSEEAIGICHFFSKISDFEERYSDMELVKSLCSLLENIEKTKSSGLKLRYFDTPETSELIGKIPPNLDHDINHTDLINIMTFILYSFYHSLEFNQFIGPGSENMLSGTLFHHLDEIEPSTLLELDSATSKATLSQSLNKYLDNLKYFLLANPEENKKSVFDNNELKKVFNLKNNEKLKKDEVLYFLEIQNCINSFLSLFSDFILDRDIFKSTQSATNNTKKLPIESKLHFFLALVKHAETENNITFSDKSWINDLEILKQDLDKASSVNKKIALLDQAFDVISALINKLDASELYAGDKALLRSFIQNLFFSCVIKNEITSTEENDSDSNSPGITGFELSDESALSAVIKSFRSFVKSLKDSTWYDLPQNPAAALQNSALIPLAKEALRLTEMAEIPVEETAVLLKQLIQVDHQIADALEVTRSVNPETPLYSDYMDYLY
jgi:hypothetical protein